MDTFTHFLSGNILYMLFKDSKFSKRENQSLYVFSITSAVLPDFDLFFKIFGSLAYYENHRGITHSLFFLTILIAASFFYFKKKTGTRLNKFFLIVAVNLFFHLFLDLTNSYGTMILSPLSDYRFSWDVFYIMDFVIISLFAAAILINRILKKFELNKYIAFLVLLLFSGYFLYSIYLNLTIKNKTKYILNDSKQRFVSVLPGKLWVLNKNVIFEDASHYYFAEYLPDRFIATQFPKFNLEIIENDFIFQKIIKADIMNFYLSFSRFPSYSISQNKDNIELKIFDLRFYDETFNPNNDMFALNFTYIKKSDSISFKFNKISGLI